MGIYRVNPLVGGSGFKVHVLDNPDGLRVVGIFLTEADAEAWIAMDSCLSEVPDPDSAGVVSERK